MRLEYLQNDITNRSLIREIFQPKYHLRFGLIVGDKDLDFNQFFGQKSSKFF